MVSCKLLPIVCFLLLTECSIFINGAQPRTESKIPAFITFLTELWSGEDESSDLRGTVSGESDIYSNAERLILNVESSLKADLDNSPYAASIRLDELDNIIANGIWAKGIVENLNNPEVFEEKFPIYKPLAEDYYISLILNKNYKKFVNSTSEYAKLPERVEYLTQESDWSDLSMFLTRNDRRTSEKAILISYTLCSLEQLIDSIRSDYEYNFKTYLLIKSIKEFHPAGLKLNNFPILQKIFPFLFQQNDDWLNTLIEWGNTLQHEASMIEMVEQLYTNIANLLDSMQKHEIKDLLFFTKLNKNLKYYVVFEATDDQLLPMSEVEVLNYEIRPAEFISAILELQEKRLDEVLYKIYKMNPLYEREEPIKNHLIEMCKGLIDFSRSLVKPECIPRYMCLLRYEPPARKHTAKLLTTAYVLSEALNKKDMRDVADVLETFLRIEDCKEAFPADCPEEYLPQNLSVPDHAEL